MIEVEAVQPTAHEFRPFKAGWGAIHWICMIPTHAFLIGLVAFGIVATIFAGDALPPLLFTAFLVGSWLAWKLGGLWFKQVAATEHRRSPTGQLPWRWRIDETGVVFDNGLQRNSVDWRGVRSVREEKDRFLFLVTPGYNPILPTRLLSPDQLSELRELIADLKSSGRLGAGSAID